LSAAKLRHGRSHAVQRLPNRCLLRARGKQGKYKCPLLREMLYDWFVDVRASVATRISPKFMLQKAKYFADMIVQSQKATGSYEDMPKVDSGWLLRFKRDKGIILRRPNMRFKCSRPVLLARLKAMWLNIIRARRLSERLFNRDLATSIYGIDEKPLHFNESGSKAMATLELQGAPSVRLKENHSATRERVSVMTTVSSCPKAASQPRKLPIEVLFKAKSEKRTRNLKKPEDINMSLQWAAKGSYRQEHIIKFLARWLDEWTPAREAAHDYRIIMMDVAGSHCAPEVRDFCWSRGYVALYHFGCTTGVAQVSD
jgi:hypothetical protein